MPSRYTLTQAPELAASNFVLVRICVVQFVFYSDFRSSFSGGFQHQFGGKVSSLDSYFVLRCLRICLCISLRNYLLFAGSVLSLSSTTTSNPWTKGSLASVSHLGLKRVMSISKNFRLDHFNIISLLLLMQPCELTLFNSPLAHINAHGAAHPLSCFQFTTYFMSNWTVCVLIIFFSVCSTFKDFK